MVARCASDHRQAGHARKRSQCRCAATRSRCAGTDAVGCRDSHVVQGAVAEAGHDDRRACAGLGDRSAAARWSRGHRVAGDAWSGSDRGEGHAQLSVTSGDDDARRSTRNRAERVVEARCGAAADRDRGLPVLAGVECAGLGAGEADLVGAIDQQWVGGQGTQRHRRDATDQAQRRGSRATVLDRCTEAVEQRRHELTGDRVRARGVSESRCINSSRHHVGLPTVGRCATTATRARGTGRRREAEHGGVGAGGGSQRVGSQRRRGGHVEGGQTDDGCRQSCSYDGEPGEFTKHGGVVPFDSGMG
ncbi:MAG: hypothetical protein FD127_2005 [Acidimicrobiaceae bacterium]|nr:MAG: hypothetical protein FD127_2005 [Acidimicrobiaceae bacterium]